MTPAEKLAFEKGLPASVNSEQLVQEFQRQHFKKLFAGRVLA